ncbi:matrixin family metalloprotease [Nibricoccus sp. IMCC34717]|uniref:matrixin family metalloprotease n=1 Tax=Nibricoccus sp. IMCC34717 TaxID=3034021 RepID=UPI00384EA870
MAFLAITTVLRGFALLDTPKWPDGVIQLTYNLGNQVTYSDGKTPNQVADAAAKLWNPYMARVSLAGVEGTAGPSPANNGQNNVFFSSDVRGQAFGPNVLAVTLLYESNGSKEADILVNRAISWNTYDDYPTLNLSPLLVHEYGHVLGLGHPDEVGQNIESIMRSVMTGTTVPADDDALGVASLYGTTKQTPVAKITSDPQDQVVYEGESAAFNVSGTGGGILTFQWHLNGSPIPGATGTWYTIPLVQKKDEGIYSVVVSNGFTTDDSAGARLTVLGVSLPVFLSEPESITVDEGDSFSFSTSTSGRNVTWEWFKDGQLLPGPHVSNLVGGPATFSDQGEYTVRVSNYAGSVVSRPARLTVNPARLPPRTGGWTTSVFLGVELRLVAVYPQRGLQYQWYKDGKIIVGASSAIYYKEKATAADIGEYCLLIKGSAGTTATYSFNVEAASFDWKNQWSGFSRFGDIVYISYEDPSRIDRYDLKKNQWLPSLPFSKPVTAVAANDTSLYLAFGDVVVKASEDGTVLKQLFIASEKVSELTLTKDWLIASTAYNGLLFIYKKDESAAAVASDLHLNPKSSITFSEKGAILYGALGSVDVGMGVIQDDGTMKPLTDSPYHAAFTIGERRVLSADQNQLLDISGVVYDAKTLEYVGAMGSASDLWFLEDGHTLALTGSRLRRLNSHYMEEGWWELKDAGSRMVVIGDTCYVFGPASGSTTSRCERIQLSEATFVYQKQATPADGQGGASYISHILMDKRGDLLLVAPVDRQVLRWSPSERRYLPGFGLIGMPNHAAYSLDSDTLYLGYASGVITGLQMSTGSERWVCTTPRALRGLATLRARIVTLESDGSHFLQSLYDFSGGLRSQYEHSPSSDVFVSDETSGRVFQFQDSGSLKDLVYTNYGSGDRFIDQVYSQYSPPFESNSRAIPLIRLSPAGDFLVNGTGQIFRSTDLKVIASLANNIEDGAWLGEVLYTLQKNGSALTVQRWGGRNYTEDANVTLPGAPKRLLVLKSGQLLVVSELRGRIGFAILNPDLSVEFSQAPTISGTRLTSISSRSKVGLGGDAMIAGFATRGAGTTRLLLRAVGPKLGAFGVGGFIVDPKIEIFDSAGTKMMTNDDWGSDSNLVDALRLAFDESGLFRFDDGSHDAALIADLPAGGYTAIVSGVGGQQGVGLVEVYTANADSTGPQLIGISTRAKVGTGADVLIGGFAVTGKTPKRVLIRGIGPALGAFGVSGVLADPKLTLYSGDKALAQNDNWGGSSELSAAFTASGSFDLPPISRDAALLTTLEPGNYTAIVEGVDNTTGVALVEIYEVPE